MKKVFVSILLLALLAAGITAATGEAADRTMGLMDLYAINGETPVWLGTAVPVYDGVLLAPAELLPEKLDRLVITDGFSVWDAEAAIPDRTGILMTIVYDSSGQAPAFSPFIMADLRDAANVSGLSVHFGDENSSRIRRAVYSLVPVTWQSQPCMLATVSGEVDPGSVMTDENGNLVGIAVAKWAEGTDRVVFMSADAMLQSMAESLDMMIDQGESNPPEGFTVTAEGNVVRFDWSAMTLPEAGEGEKLYLVIADVMNSYLTYVPIENTTDFAITLTPGRTYHSGILASADTPSVMPESYAVTILPPAEKLTDYGFTSIACAIAEAPEEGLKGDELPEPVSKVTEELLRSGRAYFYSSTSYQVTGIVQGIPLLVTLTDPEGNNYRYESSWVYDPSYMDNDTWAVSLDDAGLLEMLNATGYPEGTYEVCMYIGDALGDSFTFDLP